MIKKIKDKKEGHMNKFLKQGMVAAKNVWKLFLKTINLVYVKFQMKLEKPNYLTMDVKFVGARVNSCIIKGCNP